MTWGVFTFFFTIASLIGVWINIKKNPLCFKIWFVTNGCWAVYDFWIGAFWQGILFTTYVGLAIYGIFSWKK